jgi:hypothetical protein
MKTRSYYRRRRNRRRYDHECLGELFAVALIALAMLPLLWAAALSL